MYIGTGCLATNVGNTRGRRATFIKHNTPKERKGGKKIIFSREPGYLRFTCFYTEHSIFLKDIHIYNLVLLWLYVHVKEKSSNTIEMAWKPMKRNQIPN